MKIWRHEAEDMAKAHAEGYHTPPEGEPREGCPECEERPLREYPVKPSETSTAFQLDDRCFSHYVMDWGTIESISHTTVKTTHGVTGSELPASTWYRVRMDKTGSIELLDDGGGDWELARIVPPKIAERYGYGSDPKAVSA